MDYKGLKAIPKMQKSEIAVMMVVLILSVFWNLVYAVGIGLILASIIFMKKMGDLTADQSKVVPLDNADELALPWKDEIEFPNKFREEVFIKRLEGPLFFGYTSDFQLLSEQIPNTAKHVVIRMGKVPYMDQSGLYAMEEVLLELRRKKIKIIFEQLQMQPRIMMENIDIIPDLVPKDRIFDNFKETIVYIKDNVEDEV